MFQLLFSTPVQINEVLYSVYAADQIEGCQWEKYSAFSVNSKTHSELVYQ